MRILHERFALAGLPFTRKDLVRAVSESAGTDQAEFFRKHIEGAQPLPLEACLDRAGLEGAFQRYAGELWITPLTAPSEPQRATFSRPIARDRVLKTQKDR